MEYEFDKTNIKKYKKDDYDFVNNEEFNYTKMNIGNYRILSYWNNVPFFTLGPHFYIFLPIYVCMSFYYIGLVFYVNFGNYTLF